MSKRRRGFGFGKNPHASSTSLSTSMPHCFSSFSSRFTRLPVDQIPAGWKQGSSVQHIDNSILNSKSTFP